MRKESIRNSVLKLRNSLSKESIVESQNNILSIWKTRRDFRNIERVGFYWPKKNEISPLPIIQELLFKKIKCYLPVISKDEKSKLMVFRRYIDSSRMELNRFKIKEPAEGRAISANQLDVVFIPLVAFDKKGYRIGMGGGFFDTTFNTENEKPDSKLLGLAYEFQEVDSCFPEVHDLKLDGVICPNNFFLF
tara:strand:+ start:341 stop:913 length:573 start_codon:yes stop_codon:yes gene_type:complete